MKKLTTYIGPNIIQAIPIRTYRAVEGLFGAFIYVDTSTRTGTPSETENAVAAEASDCISTHFDFLLTHCVTFIDVLAVDCIGRNPFEPRVTNTLETARLEKRRNVEN